MEKKTLNRRDFLRLGAVSSCWRRSGSLWRRLNLPPLQLQPQRLPPRQQRLPPPPPPPPLQEVTLDVMSPVSEYEAPYREIWNVFEAETSGHQDQRVLDQ